MTRGYKKGTYHHSEETKRKIGLGNKGKTRSEELRLKISIAKKGKPSWNKGTHLSEKHKQKLRLANLGKKASEETKRKQSESAKKTAWFKGHNFGDCKKCGEHHKHYKIGKHNSKELNEKLRLANLNRKIPEWHKEILRKRFLDKNINPNYNPISLEKSRKAHLGKKATNETKKKQSLAKKGKYLGVNNPMYGKHPSLKTRKLIQKARLHQVFPTKDSKPERMLQLALDLQHIKYEKHKPIIGQPDIFIEPNICIYVDGCFWHGCKECFPNREKLYDTQIKNIVRDFRITQQLNKDGYQVIRIKEHDITNNVSNEAVKIITLIKQMQGYEFENN